MKYGCLILTSWLFFSCHLVEDENQVDEENQEHELGILHQETAYIGAILLENNEFLIYLELEDERNEIKYLVPNELGDVCELLHEEFYDFEYEDWEECTLSLGLKTIYEFGRERRLLVKVSGKILSIDPEYPKDFFAFELTQLEKIEDCPVSWEKGGEEKPLVETPWKFIGFIDSDYIIYSHPACEEEYLGLNFSDVRVNDDLAYVTYDFPDALIMKIESHIWFRTSSGVKAYYPISNSQFIPTFGLWSYQYHPGPSTAPSGNISEVPKRMRDKYDSLGLLLSTNDTVDYFIEKNILRISNSKRSLEALFVAKGKEE